MTQEEKAKRYDGALHAAKAWHNTFINTKKDKNLKQLLETIFPELAESDDERIRKWLVGTIKQIPDSSIEWETISKSDVLDWLEKQGEPLNESVYDTEDKEIYQAISIGLTDVFNECGWSDFGGIPIENIQEWLEKQDEQRSKLVDFDYNAKDSDLQEVTYFIPNGFHAEMDGNKVVVKQGKQKPKWTEEDDYNVQCCIAKAESDIANGCTGRNKELIDWLKFLKQRMEESK